MCEHGTTVTLPVVVPRDLSYTGRPEVRAKPIDSCIAPIVAALNAAGTPTRSSCCGHGRVPGNIALADGRWLIVTDSARQIDVVLARHEETQT